MIVGSKFKSTTGISSVICSAYIPETVPYMGRHTRHNPPRLSPNGKKDRPLHL